MRRLKDYLLLLLKGMAMGSADVVPGISGGTIAFITGIYQELISSIKSVDATALNHILKLRLKEFWQHINGNFLITILLGILASVVSLANLLHFLLENHPIQLWSFFFGLILISAISVAKNINSKNYMVILSGISGIAIAFYITSATPAQTPETWWFILISGAIAICAMILPGISGSFILLLLGKYAFVLAAVRDLNIYVIAIFGIGAIIGLLSFSRAISWLMQHYYNLTISLLAGFMVGSLNKIWPWKIVTKYRLNSEGEQEPLIDKNVLPTIFQEQTGNDPMVIHAILFMLFGIGIVVLIEKMATKY